MEFRIKKVNGEVFLGVENQGKEYYSRIPKDKDGIVLPSGSIPIFRKCVLIEYEDLTPTVTFFGSVEKYLLHRVTAPELQGYIAKIVSKGKKTEIESLLRGLILRGLNDLYKCPTEWEEPGTDFEATSQRCAYKLLDSKLPIPPRGKYMADVVTAHRMIFLKYLESIGVSRMMATAPGNPGTVADWCAKDTGMPVYLNVQPLAKYYHPKRWSIARGLTHLVSIKGKDDPLVKVLEAEGYSLPPMANANVICPDMGLDDAVIVSESFAKKLQTAYDEVHTHTLDNLINCRAGRKLVRSQTGMKIPGYFRSLSADLHSDCREIWIEKHGSKCPAMINRKEQFLKSHTEAEWELNHGDQSPEAWHKYSLWLKNFQPFHNYKQRWNPLNQPVRRRFVDRIDRLVVESEGGRSVLYKEYHGITKKPLMDGDKLQSEADLFKGVCKILPDESMPLIRYNDNTIVRADIVADMGNSTKKHSSLKLAHLTLVTNKVCQGLTMTCVNPLAHATTKYLERRQFLEETLESFEELIADHLQTVDVDDPCSSEELDFIHGVSSQVNILRDDIKSLIDWLPERQPSSLVKRAMSSGIYFDESLTCEMISPDGSHLGCFPAGIIRVGRHRQDSQVVGGVVGDLGKKPRKNNLKNSGKRDGFVETVIQKSFGFIDAAKELRRTDPKAAAKARDLAKVFSTSVPLYTEAE